MEKFKSEFPEPDASQRELFVNLIEEAAEVASVCQDIIHRTCKALRFGLMESQPGDGRTNAERIAMEYGNLVAVMDELLNRGIISEPHIAMGIREKHDKLRRFGQRIDPVPAPPTPDALARVDAFLTKRNAERSFAVPRPAPIVPAPDQYEGLPAVWPHSHSGVPAVDALNEHIRSPEALVTDARVILKHDLLSGMKAGTVGRIIGRDGDPYSHYWQVAFPGSTDADVDVRLLHRNQFITDGDKFFAELAPPAVGTRITLLRDVCGVPQGTAGIITITSDSHAGNIVDRAVYAHFPKYPSVSNYSLRPGDYSWSTVPEPWTPATGDKVVLLADYARLKRGALGDIETDFLCADGSIMVRFDPRNARYEIPRSLLAKVPA